ncbi:MAG: PilT/PilU family type 4a pilus ATPase [Deltaproteobacteria bacterium]|nr:PilT/PilU family type 4a pilus ATPase [Deltaproteobacteria bacterium]MBN2672260.1 PilT/PilU family type 4a pilus ATPase [Deltaproteobacteria bacterium]
MNLEQFNKYLAGAVKVGASDIHFKTGMPAAFRVKSQLLPTTGPKITPTDTEEICKHIIRDAEVLRNLKALQDYDTSYVLAGIARFRVNIFRQKGFLALVLRSIPDEVPSFEELLLPPQVEDLANYEQGLVLITGATGTGKSSTLASLIGHINENRACHIITIEDPIEFVHLDKKSSVSQREVGADTADFNRALRAALRQDPDVILVGEMRDLETIDIALKASETGHMVFSTVHTPDVSKTIGRLIGVFPPEEQAMVRIRLAENLKGIMSQRLVPRSDDGGMIVATELMKMNGSVEDAIRNPDLTATIKDIMERGREQYGTMSFDQSLTDLYKGGLISLQVAKRFSSNPSDFERALHFE